MEVVKNSGDGDMRFREEIEEDREGACVGGRGRGEGWRRLG